MPKFNLISISGNSKIDKVNGGDYIVANLSLMPNSRLCPAAKIAECAEPCLVSAGRGCFDSVKSARQRKTDLYENDRDTFMGLLIDDLVKLESYARKLDKTPVCRLNTFSDINWNEVIEAFPGVWFYDYTKMAARALLELDNYSVIFSYSNARKYFRYVSKMAQTDIPIAVVFRGELPDTFLGREVMDGDENELANALARGKIVGLRAKGKARGDEVFTVDPNNYIPVLEAV